MIAHVCATVHAECMLRKGASEKWHPPPQPQNLFVYVLLRTVLRESARLVWQTEFQLLSFSLSSEQYAAIFEEITAQTHTFTAAAAHSHPLSRVDARRMAAHRGFSFGARKC